MNLHDHKAKLRFSAQKLKLRWDETQTQWSDAVSRDFELNHIETLEQPLGAALRAIEQLSEILGRAEQDCRD
jgi:hypothetical protein